MRKHRLGVPHAMACITHQTLLISRVHEEVMILFVPLLAACPSGSYGEGCNQTCGCRNDGICHPASGRCACMPGWTGPNCTEGEWTRHRGKQSSIRQMIEWSKDGFCPCVFLPECPAGFYGADCQQRCLCQNGATCNKTNGKCTCASGWMGTACELGKTPSVTTKTLSDGSLQERSHVLDLILAVLYKNILRSGNADVTTATADGARNRR